MRTDPRVSRHSKDPPWELYTGQRSMMDVKGPPLPPPKLVYCFAKGGALTLDSTLSKVRTLARRDRNDAEAGVSSAVQSVTAPWHGGAWDSDRDSAHWSFDNPA